MPSVILAGTTLGTALSLTSDTSGELQIQTNNGATTAMTLTTGGNVGVGTVSPAAKFNVSGHSSNAIAIFSKGAANQGYTRLNNSAQTYDTYVDINNNGSNVWALFDATSSQYIDSYNPGASGYRAFYTVGSERMRIDSAGNVGIGTSSPTSKVGVISDGAPAASGNMSTGLYVGASNSYGINIGGSSSGAYAWINAAFLNNSGTAAPFVFATGSTERMRIDSSGNLLVGTTSGKGLLSVKGNVEFQGSQTSQGGEGLVPTVTYGRKMATSAVALASVAISGTVNNGAWEAGILIVRAGQQGAYSGSPGTIQATYGFEALSSTVRNFNLMGSAVTQGVTIGLAITTSGGTFTVTASYTQGDVPSVQPTHDIWITIEVHGAFQTTIS